MSRYSKILNPESQKPEKPLGYTNHSPYTQPPFWQHPIPYLLEPRPDLIRDTSLWQEILQKAWQMDDTESHEYHGLLHCLRCLGAQAEIIYFYPNGQNGQGGIKTPQTKLTRGEISEAEWEEIKRDWLNPRREMLEVILDPTWGGPSRR